MWAQNCDRYSTEGLDTAWSTFTEGGIGVGSLIKFAVEDGINLSQWREAAEAGAALTTTVVQRTIRNRLVLYPATLDGADLDEVTWLDVGLLLGGELTVLAGQGGSDKRALAVHVAVALAAGR